MKKIFRLFIILAIVYTLPVYGLNSMCANAYSYVKLASGTYSCYVTDTNGKRQTVYCSDTEIKIYNLSTYEFAVTNTTGAKL